MFPATLDDPVERVRLAARLDALTRSIAHDLYRSDTLAGARAAAMQAINLMAEEGWHMAQIEARRDGDGYTVSVTYRRGEE